MLFVCASQRHSTLCNMHSIQHMNPFHLQSMHEKAKIEIRKDTYTRGIIVQRGIKIG